MSALYDADAMYTRDALRVFGSRAAIVKALGGARHRSAIYQWDEDGLVPLAAALLLAMKAGGALKVNPRLYESLRQGHERRDARRHARR